MMFIEDPLGSERRSISNSMEEVELWREDRGDQPGE
jgi:hypothetical protein